MEGRHEEVYQCQNSRDWARGPNPTLAGCGLNFPQVNHGSAHCSHRAVSVCCLMSVSLVHSYGPCAAPIVVAAACTCLPLGASCSAVLLDQ